ncbi:hypothetical protein J4573_31515 [Actinomadura barringtoniae]|uniref:Resolvase/invertase-type recombinase catalytic domain-containing protein n=1 Tax=Actinomadura barringtoniae TaxID=1427535 RepID=A0A939T3T9_9ACTN|nr:hypothetical protein [Actinomadura barringtoniae]MBO2451656.1 hypothetical protein [Actinomadura barringtoniae]
MKDRPKTSLYNWLARAPKTETPPANGTHRRRALDEFQVRERTFTRMRACAEMHVQGQLEGEPEPQPLRFAFYGGGRAYSLTSAHTPYERQRRCALALIEPHGGQIVAEYFDLGATRTVPWHRRPQMRALLEALKTNPGQIDAVVIGRPAPVFDTEPYVPYWLLLAVLAELGAAVWIPEVGGPIDPYNEEHDLIMRAFVDPFGDRPGPSPYRSFGSEQDGCVQ